MNYKTEPITPKWCEQYSKNFKPFKVKRSGVYINNNRLSLSRVYNVSSMRIHPVGYEWVITIGKIEYHINKFRRVIEQPEPITTYQIDLTKKADDKLADLMDETVRTPLDLAIVHYVQANRNRMSDDTIRHFAELIGTIKLGML